MRSSRVIIFRLFLCGAAATNSGAAPSPAFLTPRADPSFARFGEPVTNWPGTANPLCAFVASTNCSAYTFLTWLMTRDYPAYANAYPCPQLTFSARASRATAEGGPELPAYWESSESDWQWMDGHAFLRATVPLPSGQDSPAVPRPAGVFPNGVCCVQLENPHGAEIEITSPNGTYLTFSDGETNIVFNIEITEPESYLCNIDVYGGDYVTARAAVNPPVQFFSRDLWNYDAENGSHYDRREHFVGVTPDEWQMVALRARVVSTNAVESRLDALAWDLEYWDGAAAATNAAPSATNALDAPLAAPFFERNASCRLNLASLFGSGILMTNAVYTYGAKMIPRWLSDEDLMLIRDCDVAELRRRGAAFGTYSNVWSLGWTQKVTGAVTTGAVESLYEAASAAPYTRRALTATNAYSAMMSVQNTPHADPAAWVDAQALTYHAPGAVSVASNEIAWAAAGTYPVTGTTADGRSARASVTLSGGITDRKLIERQTCAVGTVNALMDAAVLAAVDAAQYPAATNTYAGDPTREWRIRRARCIPSRTYKGSDTRGCIVQSALSPHTYFSATHWDWWYSGTEEFTDSTGRVWRVRTDYGSVVRLADWAASRGISTNGIAEWIGDIVVGAFADGGSIPEDCCPYLMTTNTAARLFATAPVLGWGGTQTAPGWLLPKLVNPYLPPSAAPFRSWVNPRELGRYTSGAVCSRVIATNAAEELTSLPTPEVAQFFMLPWEHGVTGAWDFAPVYGGDSGYPVYLDAMDGAGGLVLVSHHHGHSYGPSYAIAFPLLKAWIEAHGDAVREWDGAAYTNAPPLPYDAEVEWIEANRAGSETFFIDTGYVPSAADVISAEFMDFAAANALTCFSSTYGAWDASPNHWLTVKCSAAGAISVWAFSPYRAVTISGPVNSRIRVELDLPGKTVSFWRNGALVVNKTAASVGAAHADQPAVRLFPTIDSVRARERIYGFSAERGGAAVIDLIPVRFTNGEGETEGAMYDRVSGTLLRNVGTGAFTVGPDKE